MLSLSASTVIVKIIGLLYKIPMLSLVGGEGMGYFNSAYEIYSLLCIISITGLPVATSVIISGARHKAEGVLRVSLRLFAAIGIAFSLLMLIFSHNIAVGLKSEKAYYSILAISPSLLFVCISGAYKGYFQGLSDMRPICVSGVIEAASKLIFGLLFAVIAVRMSLPVHTVAAAGIFSVTLGSAISLSYFAVYKKRRYGDKKTPSAKTGERRKIILDIIKISFPTTASSIMMSAVRIVDMTMILRRLQDIGYTSEYANAVYGSYTTMAIPIFSLAAALVSSVAIPLIPELSREISEKSTEGQGEKISCALSLTAYISCPVMIGISLFSFEILSLIFKNQPDGVRLIAPLLSLLGLSVLSSVLITLTSAMLQAYRQAAKPLISMAAGCIVKIIISFILIGNKNINIFGAPIGTYLCDLLICILNFVFLFRYFKGRISFKKTVVIPALCSAVAIIPVFFIMRAVQHYLGVSNALTVVSIIMSAILYLLISGRRILKLKDLG